MATLEFELLGAFEVYSVKEIRKILDAGPDVHAPIKGKTLILRMLDFGAHTRLSVL